MYRRSQSMVEQTFLLSRLLLLFPLGLRQNLFKQDILAAAGVLLGKLLLGAHVLQPQQNLAQSFSAAVAYCAVVLHSLAFFCKRKTLCRLFRQLSDCDLQVGDVPLKMDWLLVVLYACSALLAHPSVNTVLKVWLALSLFGTLHPFVHLVRTLQHWFASLCRRPHATAQSLRRLCILHQRCTEACRTLNSCFSQQLLWSTCALFVHLVVASYEVFVVIEGAAGVLELADKVIGLFYYICLCFVVSSACVKASKDAKRLDTLLYQLMTADMSGLIANDEKLSLHISMRQELSFTVCNLFPLDFTLLHSMAAAGTTYLVILIQMSEPTNN